MAAALGSMATPAASMASPIMLARTERRSRSSMAMTASRSISKGSTASRVSPWLAVSSKRLSVNNGATLRVPRIAGAAA